MDYIDRLKQAQGKALREAFWGQHNAWNAMAELFNIYYEMAEDIQALKEKVNEYEKSSAGNVSLEDQGGGTGKEGSPLPSVR